MKKRSPLFYLQMLGMLWPLFRLLWLYQDKNDPWQKIEHNAPTLLFGAGSRRDFRWYREGPSSVEVTCIDDVCEWLLDCVYVQDMDLFQERDFWQHPRTFEQVMQGDCEDHALWTWRKLSELGLETWFICGHCDYENGDPNNGHAWVVFRKDGVDYLFETVANAKERMVQPLSDVCGRYIPYFSVDQDYRTYIYYGLVHFGLAFDQYKKRIKGEHKSEDKTVEMKKP